MKLHFSKMKYLFELSKEHNRLPTKEIISCLNAEDVKYNIIEKNSDIFLIETDVDQNKISNVGKRLSYTFFVDNFLFKSNNDANTIRKKSEENQIESKGSIAIKYKNRSNEINSRPIIRSLADVYTKNRKVNLDNAKIEIRALITDNTVYVGNKIFEINRTQFERRKVQNRPFFSPISLHPKIARALVNLSEIKKNQILLDPFCGTGGILLEAGLMGIEVIGSDIEEKMIDGCKKTLDYYEIQNYNLFESDIGNINSKIKPVDAVVTDMPYGKSTTTKGERPDSLYLRGFESISKILKKNTKAVVGLPNKNLAEKAIKFMDLIDIYEFKVHKSLTRYFAIYEK